MIPTWEEIDAASACLTVMVPEDEQEDYDYLTEQIKVMKNVISSFVSYHIQDCSVYVEGETHNNDVFESACIDTLTNRFVKMYVSYNQGGNLTVTDACGNVRTVDQNLCNILTRQYFFNASTLQESSRIHSSSFAVIHQIDEPLIPFKVDKEKRPYGSFYSLNEYNKVKAIVDAHPLNPTTPNSIKRKR
jgi:hypothetical protein